MQKIVIPAFQKIPISDEVSRLNSCSKFIYNASCLNCHTGHFRGFNRCKSRWCINCNHVRALAWIARLLPILEQHLEHGYISMINYTMTDQPFGKLKFMIDSLNKAFRQMYNEPAKRKNWKVKFPGGIRSLEVKLGSGSGMWHAHIHSMVLKNEYSKDSEWLIDEWKKAIKTVSGYEGSVYLKGIDKKNGLLKAVLETLKYIMKPEMSIYQQEEVLLEAYITLKGRRQINTWGLLRGLSKQVEKDIQEQDENKLTDFICQRCGYTKAELITMMQEWTKDIVLYDYIKRKDV